MGIIIMALAALVPAVTSLSKSGGRRAARNSLLGAIEQARAEAIKSGQATYVVFPTFTAGSAGTVERYNYKSFAIFKDNPASPNTPDQLTNWKTFPTGVAIRTAPMASLADMSTQVTTLPAFTPDTASTPTFRC